MEITDILFQQLVDLKRRLDQERIPFLLGGGMGLWLRDSFMHGHRSPRYPRRPESRSTNDLDLLLTTTVVVNPSTMNNLRDVLHEFGFSSVVDFMQFSREFTSGGQKRTVKVDLLGAPPPAAQREKVKISPPRIRPKEVSGIHAYLTPEAKSIQIAPVTLDLSPALPGNESGDVQIPSSMNYLILKLHAFKDRHEITDKNPDGGRHHAFDIFRIVTDMRETDWESAAGHISAERGEEYLQIAAYLTRRYFREVSALGVTRIRQNRGYQRYRAEFDSYLPHFFEDLEELFENVASPSRDVLEAWSVEEPQG